MSSGRFETRAPVQSRKKHPAARRRSTPGRGYFVVKRLLDQILVLLSSPLWLTVMTAAAIAIKIESPGGPVFFTQARTGAGGRRFRLYKLRTMVPNAEQLKEELQHLNQLPWPDFKIDNDPRITRVGAFLRRTSIDELPQLFNVLRGEMTLVGPRPTSFAKETYSVWHTQRLEAIPGLTGLWQVESRGTSDFDQRLRLDIEYLETRSTLGDLRLIVRTVLAVVMKEGR